MNERAYAVDVLRALGIVGMVLSGYIAWNPELPAWLFHAQVPPPNFEFNALIPGITWVDLVFPFFLFSMGAAMPLSLGRKLDKGAPPLRVAGSILRRGVLLVLFAIVLGNTGLWRIDNVLHRPMMSALLTLATWAAFFALFIRLPRLTSRENGYLNLGGAVSLLLLLAVNHWIGLKISIYQSDIIILILANVVVAGSFIWWATRRNLWCRMGIVALLIAWKIGAEAGDSWSACLWNGSFAPWLFRTEFLQYLCLVLPGSVAGELISSWLKHRKEAPRKEMHVGRIYAGTLLVALLFVVNLWGLYARQLGLNFTLTLVLGAGAWLLLRKTSSATCKLLYSLYITGFFWLLLGLLFEPLGGGIKKDPATVSYLFVTAGMASHVLLITTVLIEYAGWRLRLLVRCGQNPMIAYTAAGYVIMPLLLVLSQGVTMSWLWGNCGCVMSVVRGLIITVLMMFFTALFSKHKLFWRT